MYPFLILRDFPKSNQCGCAPQTIWAYPEDLGQALPNSSFDVVIDNNGKDLSAVGPVLEGAKACRAKQFLFVSSCGIYKSTNSPPLIEGDPVKEDAGAWPEPMMNAVKGC